jgi:serine/threonine-protein kinase
MRAALSIPPDTLLGNKIRLIQRIGRGGMGDVWMARNEATQAEVAVKTLAKAERNEAHDERFRREARLAATVTHRNVVRIFDLIDGDDGTLGLVMELLRGGTLEACMKERGPLSPTHAIAVAAPILSALSHVHQKGIIHRDVKPANIFFAVEPDGHIIPKILDFGIAKLPAAGSALTVDGSVLGTPHYMSPEQIRGAEDLDGRSDMFSVAVLLYEMLTGVRIFQRDSAAASLAAVLEHEVDPDPRIEPRVWVALSRALAKRPYERYATCAEFADALRAAIGANDEDFATALQELRPTSVSAAVPAPPEVGSSAARSRKRPTQKGSLLIPVAAAVAAASIAVILTLAFTRTSTPAEDNGPASSASTAAAPVSAARLDIPPPADSTGVVELGDNPPSSTTPSKPRQPMSRNPNMKPPVKTGPGKPGDPATRPGF